jgi:hypothetical protein
MKLTFEMAMARIKTIRRPTFTWYMFARKAFPDHPYFKTHATPDQRKMLKHRLQIQSALYLGRLVRANKLTRHKVRKSRTRNPRIKWLEARVRYARVRD